MTAPHDNPRRSAALILADSLANGTFPERMLEKGVPQRALVQEWVYGSMRQRRVLDFFIGKLAENPPSPMPRALLFVGLYQLFFSDGIEDHAAVIVFGEMSRDEDAVFRMNRFSRHRVFPYTV